MAHWSTGVTPGNFQDLTGKQFGRVTVISRTTNGPKGMARWVCRCECGNEKIIRGSHLIQGRINSCGCLRVEATKARLTVHGRSKTTEHNIWWAIVERCTNPAAPRYADYGGRGIYICRRWRDSFQTFLDDMGERPNKSLSVDRINNHDGYTCGKCEQCRERDQPLNCRWATRGEQANNKRNNHLVTFNDETLSLAEWARRTGLKQETIRQRLHCLGWSAERALTTPTSANATPENPS